MKPSEFTDHPIFEKLDQLTNALSVEDAKEKIELEKLNYFQAAEAYIRDRLKIVHPALVQETELNSLATEVDNTTQQINTFLGNQNSGYITNAVSYIGAAINRIKNLPLMLSKGDFQFSRSVAGFEKSVADAYKAVQEKNQKLQQELEKTQEELADKNIKLSDLEQKIAAKETEIQDVLSNLEIQFHNIKSTNEATFESDRKQIEEDVNSDRKSFSVAIDEDRKKFSEEYELYKEKLESETSETIRSLNGKLEEAQKIVSIVGNVGVTGNYQRIAEQNRRSANFFRWMALGFMAIMSILLICTILEINTANYDFTKSVLRIIAASVLTYPAVYASRESTKHRNLETKNRRLELELASLGPFIELMPDDKKESIKESLVQKYFGQKEEITYEKKEDSDEISAGTLEKILKAILPFIKN